jgi:hypothetical protein
MVFLAVVRRSKVTAQQIVGYGIALCGVTAYNMHKLHKAQPGAATDTPKAGRASPSPNVSSAGSTGSCTGSGAYAVVKIQQQWTQDTHGQQGVLRDQYTGWKLSTAVAHSYRNKLGFDEGHQRRSAPMLP